MVWKILSIVLVVLGCLYTALYTINTTSIDNMIDSITPAVFELSVEVKEDDSGIDSINIVPEMFEPIFINEVQNNLSFYNGKVSLYFYYYNVGTQTTCGETTSCNGIQIKLIMHAIYMFNKQRIYTYEVIKNGN
jgi:hypothetical protein